LSAPAARRQNTLLEAIIEEDIAVAHRNDAANAESLQRPHGVLTRTAAGEVLPGDENAAVVYGDV